MSIKIEKVAGASSGKEASTYGYDGNRRVMTCDEKGCPGRLEGDAGNSEDTLKKTAYTMGWSRHPYTSKDKCPQCTQQMDADAKYDAKSGGK